MAEPRRARPPAEGVRQTIKPNRQVSENQAWDEPAEQSFDQGEHGPADGVGERWPRTRAARIAAPASGRSVHKESRPVVGRHETIESA
jgi:hypothetical protein